MKTITVNLYTYNELDPIAQNEARKWWLDGKHQDFDSGFTIDDTKQMGAHMGLRIDDVFYNGFSSQGDGACFVGGWRADKVNLAALIEAAPQDEELHRICRGLDAIARAYPDSYFKVEHRGQYCHEYCTSFSCEPGEPVESSVPEPRWSDEFPETTLIRLARDFMKWIYRQLEKEYEWQTSEEQVAETLIANGYTFTVDGKRYVEPKL